jgi:lysophospholipase L1-like esterase
MKQLANILLVIGGGMLCLVLATSLVRLGVVITSVRTMLWIFGGTSVLLGGLFSRIYNEQSLRLSRHKVVDCYKAMAILALNALLLYGGLELAAFAAFKIRSLSLISRPAQGDPRQKVSYYSSQNWAEQYWYEHGLSVTQRYYPYVGWRRAPFKGKTIEIDHNGMRLTPGADCSATSFKVFTFGSSEMWGTGSPNWDTIPANLQKGLENLRHGPVCVMNFAESAYVSTQDVIMLLLQLRSGNVPDVVLFYNIGGDVYSAYQSGRAGTFQNFNQLAARFERGSPYIDHLRNTYSYQLIDALMGKLTIANPQQESTENELVTYASMGIDAATLSNLVVQDYFGNYNIVTALAQKYGFKYLFFLPPRIFRGNKTLTPEEQEMKRETESDAALSKLYTAVYQTVERKSSQYQNLYLMADIFDHYRGLIWIDGVHATPIGNQLIAARMLDVIQARFPIKKQSTISD